VVPPPHRIKRLIDVDRERAPRGEIGSDRHRSRRPTAGLDGDPEIPAPYEIVRHAAQTSPP